MTDSAEFIDRLIPLCREIAEGKYDHARELFELSREDSYPAEVAALAEAFGMMLVQVEAREYGLEETIAALRRTQTELSASNERLLRSLEELKEAQLQLIQKAKLESVGKLAAGVAHEVKNPLAIIQLGVDFLNSTLPPDPALRETVDDMADAVQRADRVIRGLLDFSRSEKLDLRQTSLVPVIDDSLILVRHECTKMHVSVQTEHATTLPSLALDVNKLKQVFINLFMNAIHAMPRGGNLTILTCTGSVEADLLRGSHFHGEPLRPGDEAVRVDIVDTGTGIPEDKIERLFDPFFTTKPVGVGTGLGLSITQKILELHQAAIAIGNRADGNGAIVTILFKTP